MTKTVYDPVTSIRMPVNLKRALAERAKAEGRSFSQQVVWYLRQHVEVEDADTRSRQKIRSAS